MESETEPDHQSVSGGKEVGRRITVLFSILSVFISINGQLWHIMFVTPNSNELQRNNGTYTIGMTDKLKHCIYLADTLSGSTLYDVVCHELVHAFCLSYEIYLDVEAEEMLAEFVATYSRDILQLTDDVIGEMIREKIA